MLELIPFHVKNLLGEAGKAESGSSSSYGGEMRRTGDGGDGDYGDRHDTYND